MKTDYEIIKELAEILNRKMTYANHHNVQDFYLLNDIIDEIADIFSGDDRIYFYNLCDVIPIENRNECEVKGNEILQKYLLKNRKELNNENK